MKSRLLWPLMLLVAASSSVSAQQKLEAENLEVVRVTAGERTSQDITGLVEPGVFSGDHILHWTGQENAGDLIELKVPVPGPGKYRVTLGLVKSWDYGIFQPMLDGKDAGRALDLFSGGPEDKTIPARVDIGSVEVKRDYLLLAMRYTGTNPQSKAEPNPGSMGLDYVILTAISEGGAGSGATTQTGTPTGPSNRLEAEDLEVVRASVGGVERQEMTDLAEPGTFSGDHIAHWVGQEKPGDVVEFKVPVPKPGKYAVTLGIVKSWDYGIFQPMLDGRAAGRALDLYSAGPEERSFPAKVDIGTVDVQGSYFLLGMRFTGTNPQSKADPNPGSMGLDYVVVQPASSGGGTAGGSDGTGTAVTGMWHDPQTGVVLAIHTNGTWVMAHPDPAATPRAGNWSQQGSVLTLRTHIAAASQMWDPRIPGPVVEKLISGPYDLSMVWTLQLQGESLNGTVRAGQPRVAGNALQSFVPYSNPGAVPAGAAFNRVPSPAPASLQKTLDKLR